MNRFSDRYGYTTPNKIFIRERLTPEIQDCICSCFDQLLLDFRNVDSSKTYENLQLQAWMHYLHRRRHDFYCRQSKNIIVDFIRSCNYQWYEKLNILEFTIAFLRKESEQVVWYTRIYTSFIGNLNCFFKELNFSYRVIDGLIVEVTSEEEIKSIEDSLQAMKDNVQQHLSSALNLYSKKPIGDYRNSIKESISAVEAFCREKTGQNTLGKALKSMEEHGIIIPRMLKDAFEKLYTYTNQPDTGIRHALMEEDDKYVPGQEEALFMLVSCCSFLNYLKKKE